MKLHNATLSILIFMLPLKSSAQAMDNTISYKNINCDKYFRLNYENDFFSATDKYYTQGINLELVAAWIRNFPLCKILVYPNYNYTRYGLGLEHDGYTPSSISAPQILYGDRPFTACLFLKTFLVAIDPIKKQRFSTTLSTGVIGQAAGGMEMQTAIHRWLNNITPHGWPNQIHNDAIVNYQLNYEKELLAVGHYLSIDGDAMVRAGTLNDKVNAGITIIAGYFDSPFSITTSKLNSFHVYAYEHAEINAVGYDVTLEGGLFNRTSPYTISAKAITPFVFQNRFGFVVVYKRIYIEYFQALLSNEFNTGNFHVWGGVQIAFGIGD